MSDTPSQVVPGNPFTDPGLAAGYERWYETVGRRADRLEKRLLQKLLDRFPDAHEVLEVGCGTGHFTRWMTSLGLRVVGLDVSPAMLAEARRLKTGICIEGDALNLPFDAGSFGLVVMITTLEFTSDPTGALSEAFRVARRGVILGAFNRQSRLGRQLERKGGSIWGSAHFFTVRELVRAVRRALGDRPAEIAWRTTLWPRWPRELPLPCGGFIGMAINIPRSSTLTGP
jgi:ubiquinone/menaquinone biosynthesis C-methylase UbiE